jgi:hypothetical protein
LMTGGAATYDRIVWGPNPAEVNFSSCMCMCVVLFSFFLIILKNRPKKVERKHSPKNSKQNLVPSLLGSSVNRKQTKQHKTNQDKTKQTNIKQHKQKQPKAK